MKHTDVKRLRMEAWYRLKLLFYTSMTFDAKRIISKCYPLSFIDEGSSQKRSSTLKSVNKTTQRWPTFYKNYRHLAVSWQRSINRTLEINFRISWLRYDPILFFQVEYSFHQKKKKKKSIGSFHAKSITFWPRYLGFYSNMEYDVLLAKLTWI